MKLYSLIVIVVALLVGSGVGIAVGTALNHNQVSLPRVSLAALTSPVGSPTATPTPAVPPQQLTIPSLAVAAPVELVGLDDKRRMDVPKNPDNVGWYMYGPVPGQIGNSVIAGHLDSKTGPAVFYKLNDLQLGESITVTNQAGQSHTFQVVQKATYPESDFPLQQVFGPSTKARLNLITCEGTFNKQSQNYSHRTVIYTELIN